MTTKCCNCEIESECPISDSCIECHGYLCKPCLFKNCEKCGQPYCDDCYENVSFCIICFESSCSKCQELNPLINANSYTACQNCVSRLIHEKINR